MNALRVDDAMLKRDLWKSVKLGSRIESETVRQQVARATQAKMTVAEARLLELLIYDNELREIILPQLEETDYDALATAGVFRAILELQKTVKEITLENLLELVEMDEAASDFVPVLMMSEPPREPGDAIDEVLHNAESCVFTLRSMAITNRILEISQELMLAEQSGNNELLGHLVAEQIGLARLKRDLQNRLSS